MRKFVIKIYLEGFCVQTWVEDGTVTGGSTTEDLDRAKAFDTVAEAHREMGKYILWDNLLGYEVTRRQLSYRNPC